MAIVMKCPSCNEKLSIKDEYAGRKGKCPKCQKPIQVPAQTAAVGAAAAAGAAVAPGSPRGVRRAAPKDSGESIMAASSSHLFVKLPDAPEEIRESVLNAFHGTITPPKVSLLRKLGTLFVLGVLLIMPLFYIAAVGGLGFAIYWLATSTAVPSPWNWVAAAASAIVLLCLLKPLIDPRRRTLQAYPLSADKQKLFADFISKVCEQVNAPPPAKIQMECSARLLAEYRRGLLGLLQRDVVLTVGLPLVAALSVDQFAGQLAAQMAQFRRRGACRATNCIRGINGWLWRSVYEDGRFDAYLARVASQPKFRLAKLLVPLRATRFAAQAALFIPMFIGNTVASSLVKLVEFDSDRATARLIGREGFVASLMRLGVVEFTWQGVIAELKFLHRDQQLPDSLPQQLALRMVDMTPELCSVLRDTVAKPEEKPFDARPSDAERLEATKTEPTEAMLTCNLPARALIEDYENTARQMTWDYYVSLFGPRLLKEAMVPVHLPETATVT